MALDSFVGEGLNPSPYKEALALLRECGALCAKAHYTITADDARDLRNDERIMAENLNEMYGRIWRFIGERA